MRARFQHVSVWVSGAGVCTAFVCFSDVVAVAAGACVRERGRAVFEWWRLLCVCLYSGGGGLLCVCVCVCYPDQCAPGR